VVRKTNLCIGISTLAILAVANGAIWSDARAQTAAPESMGSVNELIVTGTRVVGRTAIQTISPIDVVSSATLEHNGSTELAEALSVALPSLDFPRPTVTNGTDTVRPVTLRGLSPDEALVLVDSKRRQTAALVNVNSTIGRGSSGVDLNTIPTAAVGTIEVLRDGASAQYGSDAIAGVVNIRLREASHGGEASVTYGEYDTDIHFTPQAVPAGATWTVPTHRHADDGATTTLSGWSGFDLGGKGFVTLTLEAKNSAKTTRAGPDPTPQYSLVNGQYDPREATFNRTDIAFGDPAISQYTAFLNTGYDLSSDTHLYGWGSYQRRDAVSDGVFRKPCSATTTCPTSLTTSTTNSSIQDITSIYPNGFLPEIKPIVQDASAAAGAAFSLAGWKMDSSLVYGMNKMDFHVGNSINVALGPTSPTSFYAGSLEYGQVIYDLSGSHAFDVSWMTKPINVDAGVEARYEYFNITAGDPNSYVPSGGFNQGVIQTAVTAGGKTVPVSAGDQVFVGYTPANAGSHGRESGAAYLDIDLTPIDKFDVDGAVRAEDYSDFGSVVTGKIAGRYDFTSFFALRGSVSNGFRAPSLQQTYYTSTATTFITGANGTATPFSIQTVPVTSAAAVAVGATPLKPERSTNFSVGSVLHQGPFSFTLDAFHIDITNKIVLSENLTSPQALINLLPAGVTGVRFFTNGVNVTDQGLDAVATYAWRPTQDIGRFDFSLSGSHMEVDVTKLPTTNVLASIPNAPVLFGRINTLVLEKGQPKYKAIFQSDWAKGSFGATFRATYYGDTLTPGATAASDLNNGARTLIDLEARYAVIKNVQLSLGANNLLDVYPAAFPNSTGASFSSYSPFGFDGRYLYGRIRYTW
jgi:iron complex outermembrane receptor protein